MATFEVAVYNRTVREKVAVGEHHREIKDDWADTHYFEIEANDATTARRKAEGKFPSARGFVIADISTPKF